MNTQLRSLFIWLIFSCVGWGEVATQPAVPIRYEMTLRFVVTETSSGTRANNLGNPTQRNYIQTEMNRILAQFGARVTLSTSDLRWVSSYAYEGTGTGTRTTADLSWIFSNIPAAFYQPVEGVITVVLCARTPGFGYPATYYTNGYAYIDGNGVTFCLGSGMLQNNGNMDIVASVLAHEVGHNLGLNHVNDGENLMNSTVYKGNLLKNQMNFIVDRRFMHGFFAQIGAPELIFSRNGNNLDFSYLRSTNGISQFASTTSLTTNSWREESSILTKGIFKRNSVPIGSDPSKFFRVQPPAAAARAFSVHSAAPRALPPIEAATVDCSGPVGSPNPP